MSTDDTVFIHIPKNAGTSILNLLKNNAELSGIKYAGHAAKEELIKNKKQLIVIREPLDRFCSRDTLQNLPPARLARDERMRDDGGHDADDLRP